MAETQAPDAPTYDNGFLLPGKECECDVDFRCANHDAAAEQAYWAAQFNSAPPAVALDAEEIALAYEPGDPKRLDLLERVGS